MSWLPMIVAATTNWQPRRKPLPPNKRHQDTRRKKRERDRRKEERSEIAQR